MGGLETQAAQWRNMFCPARVPGMPARTVLVSGKVHSVSVYRLAENVWVAVGDYQGEALRVQGRSEKTALNRWRDTADGRGNGAGVIRQPNDLS